MYHDQAYFVEPNILADFLSILHLHIVFTSTHIDSYLFHFDFCHCALIIVLCDQSKASASPIIMLFDNLPLALPMVPFGPQAEYELAIVAGFIYESCRYVIDGLGRLMRCGMDKL